jgi:hypothetical protein
MPVPFRERTCAPVAGSTPLCSKSPQSWAAAVPPDVRRWLCPADSSQIGPGATPLVRAVALADSVGQRPDQGRSPRILKDLNGGAEPPPHIRRQSRTQHPLRLLRESWEHRFFRTSFPPLGRTSALSKHRKKDVHKCAIFYAIEFRLTQS